MSEIVASGICEKGVLQQLIDTYRAITDECKMHFNDDGIYVRAVDPANVAMAMTDLNAAAFENYDSPGTVTVGINLNRFKEYLDIADNGDLVNVEVDMETRKLHVNVRNIENKMRLIDPDAVRREPDTPSVIDELPNEFEATGAELREVATVADLSSDHVKLRGDPDTEELSFFAAGDIDESTIQFDDEGRYIDIREKAASLFSLEYFEDLAGAIPKDATVTVTFGDEFPATLEWEASEGHQDTMQFLAPRIQSN